MENRKDLIVGIDPGTTSSIAILNLKGKLESKMSKKNFGKEEIIRKIASKGRPVLIGVDISSPPSLAEKISHSFNAKLFSPEKDLQIKEKEELTREYDVKNSHERDALASAINAFNFHKPKLKKVEKIISELSLYPYEERIKSLILKEEIENISSAIERIVESEEKEEEEKEEKVEKKKGRDELENEIKKLKSNLTVARDSVKSLRNYSERLKEEKNEVKKDLKKIREEKEELEEGRKDEILKDDEIHRLSRRLSTLTRKLEEIKRENKNLKKKLGIYQEIEAKRKKGLIPVIVVENFKKNKLMKSEFEINNRIIFFRKIENPDASVIKYLKNENVRAVMGDFPQELKEKLLAREIPVIKGKKLKEMNGDLGFIEPEALEKGRLADKGSFIKWLKNYRSRI